jgi:hypothetical protein
MTMSNWMDDTGAAGGAAQDTFASGGSAAAAAADPPAGQTGEDAAETAASLAGQTGEDAAETAAWRQIGIPQHMLKDTPEDTLREVVKALHGFQKRASAAGPVGKSPDDYSFDFSDTLKPYFPNADDPALAAFRKVAHEMGLPVKAAREIVHKVFEPLAREGKLPQPFDPKAELDLQAKALGKSGPEAAAAIQQAHVEMEAWAQNIGKSLGLTEGEQVELESLALTGHGFGLLRKLMAGAGGDSFRLGGQGAVPPKTRAELDAMASDPRLDPFSPAYDSAFREAYDNAWAELTRKRSGN